MKALFFDTSLSRALATQALSRVSRAAALGPLSSLRYADIPEPRLPGPRWLKVRNRACGLCGTDLHFMLMDIDPKSFVAASPGVDRKYLGHELVGEVMEVGGEVDGFSRGDRIVQRIDWPSCNQMEITPPCPRCAEGSYMLCENLGLKPAAVRDQGGGFSPLMVMHRSQPFKVPAALSDDHALLLEPLACAVHGILKAAIRPGDKALVLGAGTIGLLTAAALQALHPKADIHCLARYEFQAAVARRYGAVAHLDGADRYARLARATGARHLKGHLGNEIMLGGFDVVYDSVGTAASLNDSLRYVRGGGAVVLVGIDMHPGMLDFSPVWSQEVRLTGINCHGTEADGRTSFDHAADLLLTGKIDPADFITHRFPVACYKKALVAFQAKGASKAIKIVLTHP